MSAQTVSPEPSDTAEVSLPQKIRKVTSNQAGN